MASRHSAAIEGWLLAGVGGTRTRLALLAAGGTLGPIYVTDNDRYPDLHALIASGLPKDRSRFGAALAVAAPIVGDAVAMTNRDWDFSIAGLKRELGVARLRVLNDFTAIAWSIPVLATEDTLAIGGGMARAGARSGRWAPALGSGCRGSFPAIRVAPHWPAKAGMSRSRPPARQTKGCSRWCADASAMPRPSAWSRGPGLVTLYECLRTLAGQEPRTVRPEEVIALAIGGSEPIAERALGMFFGFLGSVAGDLALTLGALGGVYLAGGILPGLADALAASAFRERFLAKGRYRRYLEPIPTRLIVHPCPALPGLGAVVERA